MSPERILPVIPACLWLLFIPGIHAGDTSHNGLTGTTKENNNDVSGRETSRPAATEFDWVQLTSGEWLKGDIKDMYDETLEFDSDVLGLQQLDWEDVRYLKTHIPGSALVEGYGTVYGYFEITTDKLIVTDGGRTREFDRALLISFITGGEEEIDYWSAKLTLGINLRSGNTDQVDYNAKANVKRETSFSRFIMDYIGTISQISGDETSNNHRVNASHDIFKTRRFFLRPLFGEYFRDPFLNIESKITAGAGLGYTIIDTSRSEWTVFGGPGYQETRFTSVRAGEDEKETTPAAALGTDYDIELTRQIDYIFKYNITWVNQASGGYTHHLVNTFEIELTNSFDLDVSLIWDHINNPTEEDDGTIPDKDDYRLTVGISYDF